MNDSVKKLPITTENPQTSITDRPWAALDTLRQEIDRLFTDFHPFSLGAPVARGLRSLDPSAFPWKVAPAVDMIEKDGFYEVTAELPGMDDKSVEVKVANGVLTIRGEKSEEKSEDKKDYHLSERRYGSFQRSFALPDGIDRDKIEATFSKGLLSVTLPKTAEAVSSEKKIEIKAA
ncbi:Hsp20/alpha crystallin family protein [Rhizobium sp. SL42]|uniref:Hsp20/alpha crystallin family protein n=1 Tax=Rhizobium sp. SL42 TaxID=2806346 RepID=UPI001F3E928B|nr:Hsp20/alpha crystallin family protein [Rhizobium sp. SL42]UJW76283.1 Hsp20/alpha crystallin family protein [Rhizobium sp. SL42]